MKLSEIDLWIGIHEGHIRALEEQRREIINKAQRKVKYLERWYDVQQVNDLGCYINHLHYPVVFVLWDEVDDKQGFDDE